MPPRPHLSLGLIGLAVAVAATPGSAAPEPSPWESASVLLPNDARRGFIAEGLAAPDAAARRAARFGEAVTLLDVQPKTPANVQRAADLLDEVRRENPDDDLGISAGYLRARIEQLHRARPDLARARAMLDEIADRHPGHPDGQRALLKAWLLRIYEPMPLEEKQRLLREAEALVERFTVIPLRGEFHQVLAGAANRFDMPPAWRLRHLLAAHELGIARLSPRRDNLLAIAETARRAGERELALQFYDRFVAEAVRDDRNFYARQRAAALRDGREVP